MSDNVIDGIVWYIEKYGRKQRQRERQREKPDYGLWRGEKVNIRSIEDARL